VSAMDHPGTRTRSASETSDGSQQSRRVLWIGIILGIGLMGAIDTIIFHQLLQWHHFYYDTTDYWRIFSDGLLHTFTATMLVLGSMRLWSQRREAARILSSVPLWSGMLLGAGGFQLLDGIVIHKILRLHQIREGADSHLPYDIAWNGFALVLLVGGWWLWRNHQRSSGETP
jgi:uncharacterized membrane protein